MSKHKQAINKHITDIEAFASVANYVSDSELIDKQAANELEEKIDRLFVKISNEKAYFKRLL